MIGSRIWDKVSALRQARREAKQARQDARHLDMMLYSLRKEYPTSRIGRCNLRQTSLGIYSAVMDYVCLDHVVLGDFSYVSTNAILANTKIGKFCSIGPSVHIGLAPHPVREFVSTYPAFYSKNNVGCPLNFRSDSVFDDSVPMTTLGNDVWIGANVIIPGGITIGTGAVIAAGAVVTKDVGPYELILGNPGRLKGYVCPCGNRAHQKQNDIYMCESCLQL